jgi:hypothetical protein
MSNISIKEIKSHGDDLARRLLDAIESGDHAKILEAQQALTDALTTLWNTVGASGIDPKEKAVARLVTGWATDELAKQIHDPANYAEIKGQLKILQRSLLLLSQSSDPLPK